MTADDLKHRLERFIDRAWSRGDLTAVDDFVGASYTVRHDPGDPWDGQELTPEGLKDRIATSRAPFPDQKFDIVRMVREGNHVAVSWHWTGTHKGDIPGFPASDRALTMSGITLYDFDAEGRIVGHWQLADRLGVYRQLTAEG